MGFWKWLYYGLRHRDWGVWRFMFTITLGTSILATSISNVALGNPYALPLQIRIPLAVSGVLIMLYGVYSSER